jgi:hypothetical protein
MQRAALIDMAVDMTVARRPELPVGVAAMMGHARIVMHVLVMHVRIGRVREGLRALQRRRDDARQLGGEEKHRQCTDQAGYRP